MERDIRLDYLKGIAILIVILGHIIQFSIVDYTDTFLFNIIWSLQIPLFMLISGYFSVSSRKRTIGQKIISKAQHYLMPFLSCFIINCMINNSLNFASFKELAFHLENSLWYLFVLFVLGVMNDVASEISKMGKSSVIIHLLVFIFEVAIWLIVWKFFGSAFFGCKFIVYYSMFFAVGWLWRLYANTINEFINGNKCEVLVALCFIAYFIIISKVNLYHTEDSLIGIIPRVIASFLGIFILIVSVYKTFAHNTINNKVVLCGRYSLELYYVHYLLVRHIPSSGGTILTAVGMLAIVVYFVYIIAVSGLIIKLISSFKYLKFLLFGK